MSRWISSDPSYYDGMLPRCTSCPAMYTTRLVDMLFVLSSSCMLIICIYTPVCMCVHGKPCRARMFLLCSTIPMVSFYVFIVGSVSVTLTRVIRGAEAVRSANTARPPRDSPSHSLPARNTALSSVSSAASSRRLDTSVIQVHRQTLLGGRVPRCIEDGVDGGQTALRVSPNSHKREWR